MPSTTENRLKVRDAWKVGAMYHASNFETVCGLVYSYHHIIGITDEQGKRVAFDCHYSRQTSAHCHVLFAAADEIQQCSQHPHPTSKPGPVPEDSHAQNLTYKNGPAPGHDSALLRAGIEAALGTILVIRSGKAKYAGAGLTRIERGLHNVLEGKGYHDAP
jgi:hypothetical protein